MNILIACGLSNPKLLSKLAPLTASPEIEKIYIVRRERIAGDKIVCFSPPRLLKRNIVLAELYRIITLLYLCLKVKPELLVGIYFCPHGIYVAILGKLLGIKVIQLLIGKDLELCLKHRTLIGLLTWSQAVGVRGTNSKQALIKRGFKEDDIFIPPNIFDFDEFQPQPADKEYDVVYVGLLARYKRLDILLKAVASVKQSIPRIKLAIIGRGKLETKLKRLAQRLGLGDNVCFIGHKNNIAYYLNRSRILILTSEAEGLPMVMIEALSCGLPVVVPDNADITTVAKDGVNALVVRPPHPEAFARAIIRLLTDNRLYTHLARNAIKIRRDYAYEYSLENALKVWEAVLAQL
jgi:glycosyltransferase involved in cell wall biosynthesis